MKSKVVGVTIDTKSPHTKKKIYYYETNEDLSKGQTFRIETPRGGTPNATVVVEDSKKKINNIKKINRA